jgi:hypothetical protein
MGIGSVSILGMKRSEIGAGLGEREDRAADKVGASDGMEAGAEAVRVGRTIDPVAEGAGSATSAPSTILAATNTIKNGVTLVHDLIVSHLGPDEATRIPHGADPPQPHSTPWVDGLAFR